MAGAGTDVALETADVALMHDDIAKLPFLITLSGDRDKNGGWRVAMKREMEIKMKTKTKMKMKTKTKTKRSRAHAK